MGAKPDGKNRVVGTGRYVSNAVQPTAKLGIAKHPKRSHHRPSVGRHERSAYKTDKSANSPSTPTDSPPTTTPRLTVARLLEAWRNEDARAMRERDDLPSILNEGRPSGRKLFDE